MTDVAVSRVPSSARPSRGNGGSFVLAYLAAALLVVWLLWAGGLWNFLANSRILDLLMRSGIVAFTDADQGFYKGVPDAEYYLAAKDPVEWVLLALTALLVLGVFALRAVRFEAITRTIGITARRGSPARAQLYGSVVGAFLPYNAGQLATAAVLEDRGATAPDAARALVFARSLALLEMAVFTFVGLVTRSWTTALGQLVPAAVVLGVAYFLVRPPADRREVEGGPFSGVGPAASALAQQPGALLRLGVLSAISFFLEVVTVYALSQAFSSSNVILNVDFAVILMAVVAGHVASYVRVTPGGLGQFELGMAFALYFGGVGLPESVTIPLLYAVLRYIISFVVYLVVRSTGRSQIDDTPGVLVEGA